MRTAFGLLVVLLLVSRFGYPSEPRWPFDVTDLQDREKLVILVFGDSGTGSGGQYRVGSAMVDICRQRGCDFALMLGDNIYENGIEVRERSDTKASYEEIVAQFDTKFESAYEQFEQTPGFHIWTVAGNHDYRKNAFGAMLTYSEFSKLWRMPAYHYEIPLLPEWIQVYGLHTDTDKRRDLNGLQIASAKRVLCGAGQADRWKLAFGHQPIYNSGHHRDDSNERRTRSLLENPLFRECGVHMYFAGHAHHQEHLTASGFEQVIQGAAGKSKGKNRPPKEPSLNQRHFSKTFGFAIVEIDPNRVGMDFYDVLNTREKAKDFSPPTPDEIVLSYSWCATQDEVGRPDLEPECK